MEATGSDSLAYFALRRDKPYFFTRDRTAFLAYRAAAASRSSPATPSATRPPLRRSRISRPTVAAWPGVRRRRCRSEMHGHWEAVGLQTIYIGDEAVVHPATFSLEGRAVRKVRQSVTRLDRLGYSVESSAPISWARERRDDRQGVSVARGQPERGFTVAPDDIRASTRGTRCRARA